MADSAASYYQNQDNTQWDLAARKDCSALDLKLMGREDRVRTEPGVNNE